MQYCLKVLAESESAVWEASGSEEEHGPPSVKAKLGVTSKPKELVPKIAKREHCKGCFNQDSDS